MFVIMLALQLLGRVLDATAPNTIQGWGWTGRRDGSQVHTRPESFGVVRDSRQQHKLAQVAEKKHRAMNVIMVPACMKSSAVLIGIHRVDGTNENLVNVFQHGAAWTADHGIVLIHLPR